MRAVCGLDVHKDSVYLCILNFQLICSDNTRFKANYL